MNISKNNLSSLEISIVNTSQSGKAFLIVFTTSFTMFYINDDGNPRITGSQILKCVKRYYTVIGQTNHAESSFLPRPT